MSDGFRYGLVYLLLNYLPKSLIHILPGKTPGNLRRNIQSINLFPPYWEFYYFNGMMKRNFIKTGAIFTLASLLFSSCLKSSVEDPIIIIDPPTWGNSTVWQEIQKKSSTTDWKTIANGNRLSVWWEYANTTRTTIIGAYNYDPSNLGISIDTAGYIQLKDNLLYYVNFTNNGIRDTTTVEYSNYGDTALVIRDTSVEPATEIRYKKIK